MPRHEIATKKIVYQIAGADAVSVRRDLLFRDTVAGPLGMDVYYPPDTRSGVPLPAMIFVIGFPGPGTIARLGCAAKEMESFIGWARLVAMSGVIAVTYAAGEQPADDLAALATRLRADAAALGIDDRRIGIWSCSGHAPTAMTMLMRDAPLGAACAVLYYPYVLDLNEATAIRDAANAFGFAAPCAGRRADELAPNVPMFVARAGLDQMPNLNAALDRFLGAALTRNLPVTIVNHATAPHAFDLTDDTDATRSVIRQTLAFIRERLQLTDPVVGP
jgi:hypothetical protein